MFSVERVQVLSRRAYRGVRGAHDSKGNLPGNQECVPCASAWPLDTRYASRTSSRARSEPETAAQLWIIARRAALRRRSCCGQMSSPWDGHACLFVRSFLPFSRWNPDPEVPMSPGSQADTRCIVFLSSRSDLDPVRSVLSQRASRRSPLPPCPPGGRGR